MPTGVARVPLIAVLVAAACSSTTTGRPDGDATAGASAEASGGIAYLDPALPVAGRVADLLSRMTLPEKIGQMTQVALGSISAEEIREQAVGSIVNGGNGVPETNTPAGWAEMVDGFQRASLGSRLGVPLLYAVDAIHGHGNVYGATVFPHNVALGAANDSTLTRQIGRATAVEMAATGTWWNLAPVVAVPQDIRWGRTYESYSSDVGIVSSLGAEYIEGLQRAEGEDRLASTEDVLATAKHFIGDGGTTWKTSALPHSILDQGDARMSEAELRRLFLPPYQAAIEAGVGAVMVSFSSWLGTKMHENEYLVSGVLKGELGFEGVVVSDWGGVDQISESYEESVVKAINAGIDMVMVPFDYRRFMSTLIAAVDSGSVPESRIDDAVARILTAKFSLGLFEQPMARVDLLVKVGSDEHRELARTAVQRSVVVLKNRSSILPLDRRLIDTLVVAGDAADDVGVQSGGWTISHQGQTGDVIPGTTILEGIEQALEPDTLLVFDAAGDFSEVVDARGRRIDPDLAVVVIGESPYAEGPGDRESLKLSQRQLDTLDRVRGAGAPVIVVLVTGRPLVVTEQLPEWDALVVAWLPGSEGAGVADTLFGAAPFTGALPFSWPCADAGDETANCEGPLFPIGFGL